MLAAGGVEAGGPLLGTLTTTGARGVAFAVAGVLRGTSGRLGSWVRRGVGAWACCSWYFSTG